MKTAVLISVFLYGLLGICTFSLAAEDFYRVQVSSETDKKEILCNVQKLCFLSLPYADDFIDVAIKFSRYKATVQYLYKKKILYTTSIGSSVAEISMRSLPTHATIDLYESNTQLNDSGDLRQLPVIRRGIHLISLQVKISDGREAD